MKLDIPHKALKRYVIIFHAAGKITGIVSRGSFGWKPRNIWLGFVGVSNEAVELAPHAYPCTDEMLQLVNIIIRNQHSDAGREKMLENHLESVLITDSGRKQIHTYP